MAEKSLEFTLIQNHIQLYARWMLELFHNAQKIHHKNLRRFFGKKQNVDQCIHHKYELSSFLLFLLEEYVELMYH